MTVLVTLVIVLGGVNLVAAPVALADGVTETTGGAARTWTNYTNAGGYEGPTIPGYTSVQIACKLQGFRVPNGNTWWYRIASSPWNYAYYVSADPFYNNGQTSGPIKGTPYVDPNVPDCSSGGGVTETAGGAAQTWTNSSNAGGTQGATIGGGAQVQIACKLQGFRVPNGNTWWYRIASAPWNSGFYVSADAFYNNGQTSGSLRGTPFVDPAVPDCSTAPPPVSGVNETAGGVASTWSDHTSAGGTRGPSVPAYTTVTIACKLNGFRVANGNTWWYRIASSPWSSSFYVSADAFYNNGATSGSLVGTPFVDSNVPTCSTAGAPKPGGETAGGYANTWTNYYNAGGVAGPAITAGTTVQVTCRVNGFRVPNGNTWWYQIASSPWNDNFYVSADAFYNNGATSGDLRGTPYVDSAVPVCSNNREASGAGTAYGRAAVSAQQPCWRGDPVNCATGDFWETFTDVQVGGRGPGLHLERTYNSITASTSVGAFGPGWTSSWDQHLSIGRDGSAALTFADGSQVIAQPDDAGGFVVPAWANSTLARTAGGGYRFVLHTSTVLTFDAAGRLVGIGDRNGYTTVLQYDAAGHLASVVDTAGRAVGVTTDGAGRITQVVDPSGAATSYAYDGSGNLARVVDALGRMTSLGYDASNRMVSATDPRGGVVTNSYDPATGRIVSQVDAAGRHTTWAYTGDNFSSAGGTTTVIDPHGDVEVHQYANGYLMTLTKGAGSGQQGTWTYSYDLSTNGVTSVTDPNGDTTRRTFSVTGQVLSETTASGRTTSTAYNAFDQPVSVTSPSGAVTSSAYDASGNPLSVTAPSGAVTSTAYGDPSHPGDATSSTDADGRVTSSVLDGFGNVVSEARMPTAGQVLRSVAGFDADGRVVCAASGKAVASGVSCSGVSGAAPVAGATTSVFDAVGQVVSTTDAAGRTSRFGYDESGNRVSATDPSGVLTSTVFDGVGRVMSQTVGAGSATAATTSTAYDVAPAAGGCPAAVGVRYCTVVTDATGGVTVHGFDARDDEVVQVLPGGMTSSSGFDGAGRRTSVTDAVGRVTRFGFDGDGRTVSTTYSDGSTPAVAWTYDADGRRTSMTDGTGTTSYSYDADGRTTRVVDGSGVAVGYGYDRAGNTTSIVYPNGQTVTRRFDGAGRLSAVSDWAGRTATFSYDADSNVTSTGYGSAARVVSGFDASGALTSTQALRGAGTVLAGAAYGRDANGRVASESTSGGLGTATTALSYDTRDQLTGSGAGTYQYDLAGNLTNNAGTAQTFNAADQVVATSRAGVTTAYSYAPTGERTAVTPAVGATWAYGYDQAGRMTSAVKTTAATPKVTAVTPAVTSPIGGATVVITGTGLTGAKAVTLNGVAPASFTVDSDTQITVLTAAAAASSGYVRVTTQAGVTAAGTTSRFVVKAPVPLIAQVSPTAGPRTGGTAMVITGRGFTGATSVLFGSTAAPSFTVVDDTRIDVTTPVSAVATRDVRVTTPGGRSAVTAADVFTYTADTTPVAGGTYGSPPAVTTPTPPSGTPSPTTSTSVNYTYNGDGLRVGQNTAGVTQHFGFDARDDLPQVLDDGARSYLYGPTGTPIAQIDPSGVLQWMFTDQIGNTRALISSAGAVTATWNYTPYGTVARRTGSGTTPLQYAGLYTDNGTGQNYAIARNYDPATGTFTTVDPLVGTTGDAYAYAAGNPTTNTDPSGKWSVSACFGICFAWDGTRHLGAGLGTPGVGVNNFSVGGKGFGGSAIAYTNGTLDWGAGFVIGASGSVNVYTGQHSYAPCGSVWLVSACGPQYDPSTAKQMPSPKPGQDDFINKLKSGQLKPQSGPYGQTISATRPDCSSPQYFWA